ncbi:hypothetical protein QUB37_02260 [Microcoleus sp. AT3-A2]
MPVRWKSEVRQRIGSTDETDVSPMSVARKKKGRRKEEERKKEKKM